MAQGDIVAAVWKDPDGVPQEWRYYLDMGDRLIRLRLDDTDQQVLASLEMDADRIWWFRQPDGADRP